MIVVIILMFNGSARRAERIIVSLRFFCSERRAERTERSAEEIWKRAIIVLGLGGCMTVEILVFGCRTRSGETTTKRTVEAVGFGCAVNVVERTVVALLLRYGAGSADRIVVVRFGSGGKGRT